MMITLTIHTHRIQKRGPYFASFYMNEEHLDNIFSARWKKNYLISLNYIYVANWLILIFL